MSRADCWGAVRTSTGCATANGCVILPRAKPKCFPVRWLAISQLPFTSEATFVEGELQGKWTVTDSRDRTVFCSNFDHGQRDGKSIWYFSNGQKWREVDFQAVKSMAC